MRMLVGIPMFKISDLARRCLASVVGTPADVLSIDNNAEFDIKMLLKNEFPQVKIIFNTENGYCNGGWNQIMKYGLERGYDIIALGSSDAGLPPFWYECVKYRWEKYAEEVWVPIIGEAHPNPDPEAIEYVFGGVAGFFTFLPIEAVKLVYPIPSEIKHWFGDQWIYTILRAHGWKVTLMHQVRAFHEQSAVTSATPEAHEVITQDIAVWPTLTERLNQKCIKI